MFYHIIIVSGSSHSQSTVLSPDVVSCPDAEVTFSCQGLGVLVWRITLFSDGTELMDQPPEKIYIDSDQLGSSTVMSGGFSFHFTLVETSPTLRSTMRTSLPLSLNTTLVECRPSVGMADNSSFLFLGVLQLLVSCVTNIVSLLYNIIVSFSSQ